MSKDYSFVTLDVFTDQVFGGNPLAVLPNTEGLSTKTMQAVAREFNLSETTFVSPPDNPDNTHKVRIFTPVAELEFAGHPTLGTAITLALNTPDHAEAYAFKFEEGAGVVPVSVTRGANGLMRAELSVAMIPEKLKHELKPAIWAQVLGLDSSLICPSDQQVGTWSCGAPFAFVPVSDLNALRQAAVNAAFWAQHLAHSALTGVFIFTRDTDEPDSHIRARMFAPSHGIAEDPATGGAVAALAGWLVEDSALTDGTHEWVIEQGVEMGRPSRLELVADISNAQITAVRVAGTAVHVSSGSITIP